MAIEQLPSPCWYSRYKGGEDYQNRIHFGSQAEAEADRTSILEDEPDREVEVGQHPSCWIATCDGDGGEEYEDDEVGLIHFVSRAEAEDELRQAGWFLLRDGRTFCFDCEPGEDAEPLPVAVPGQVALPGLGGEAP